jgi:hypothetical protein
MRAKAAVIRRSSSAILLWSLIQMPLCLCLAALDAGRLLFLQPPNAAAIPHLATANTHPVYFAMTESPWPSVISILSQTNG